MDSKKVRYILALVLTLTGFALSANATPPMITTFSRLLKSNTFSFGIFIMIQYLCFSAASFFGNYLKKQRGVANSTLLSIGLFTLAGLFFSTVLFINDTGVVVWLILLGFCGGLIETFSSDQLAGMEKKGSARLVSLSQVFYCIGGIVSPLLVGIFLHFYLPWSWIFIVLGLLILGIGLNFVLVQFSGANVPVEAATAGVPVRVRELGNRRAAFFLLMVLMFVYTLLELGIVVWLPFYLEKGKLLPPQAAAIGLSCFWAGVLAGRGLIVIGLQGKSLPLLLLLFFPICSAAIVITLGTAQLIVLMIAAFLLGFGAGPVWPSVVAFSKHLNISATFTGTIIGIGAVGASFGPFLGGLLIDSLGVGSLFKGYLILSLILVILSAFVYRFARDLHTPSN